MENKTKRFYKVGQMVWSVILKKEVKVKAINKEEKEILVTEKKGAEIIEHTFKLWEVDILKYSAKEKIVAKTIKSKKKNYFSSVNGGIIPTKTEENAGRDCYARIEPIEREGRLIHELYLPQFKLTKIPLGFASYLNYDDALSLKHERSSIGSVGLVNVSGLIDATYQGEVKLQVIPLVGNVVITSEVTEIEFDEVTNTYFVPYSKAIAQAVVLKLSDTEDVHIPYEDLLKKPSTRGIKGWGSSGK